MKICKPSVLIGVFSLLCLLQIGQSWLVPPLNPNPFVPLNSILTATVNTNTNTNISTADQLTMVDQTNPQGTETPTGGGTQKLILIRHATSQGNEFLAQPGNRWGDPTFCDDANLTDARLTETGMRQVREELLPKFLQDAELLRQVDLVLVSPLTRTQQTFQYGVLPALQQQRPGTSLPPILAQPLSTERVYTASDTGRSPQQLSVEFPWVDWSLMTQQQQQHNNSDGDNEQVWWYTHRDQKDVHNYREWRPYGQGQWYAVPGEPMDVFQRRMKKLEDWIAARKERIILLVAHWAVFHYLTGGYDSANCEVKVLDQWKPLHQQEADQAQDKAKLK